MQDRDITDSARDEDEGFRYDVRAHLLKFGKMLNGRIPQVDAFIPTYADQYYCRSFKTTFCTGAPSPAATNT